MKKILTKRSYFILAFITAIMTSCYGDLSSNYADYGLVLTAYNDEADFQVNRTYALPDSVEVLPPEDDSGEADHTFDILILQEIESQMDALGYTLEPDPDTNVPDLYIAVAQSTRDVFNYWSYYPGWYWGPGYGWGYPCYSCNSYIEYAYSTGTVYINMIQSDKIDEEEKIVPSIWFAALNGIISGSSEERIAVALRDGIFQAFAQSPYLKIN